MGNRCCNREKRRLGIEGWCLRAEKNLFRFGRRNRKRVSLMLFKTWRSMHGGSGGLSTHRALLLLLLLLLPFFSRSFISSNVQLTTEATISETRAQQFSASWQRRCFWTDCLWHYTYNYFARIFFSIS